MYASRPTGRASSTASFSAAFRSARGPCSSRQAMHQHEPGIGVPPRGPFRSKNSTSSSQRSAVTGCTSTSAPVGRATVMPMLQESDPTGAHEQEVAELLCVVYDLRPIEVLRIPAGTATINYRVIDEAGDQWFAKVYRDRSRSHGSGRRWNWPSSPGPGRCRCRPFAVPARRVDQGLGPAADVGVGVRHRRRDRRGWADRPSLARGRRDARSATPPVRRAPRVRAEAAAGCGDLRP